MSPQELAKYEMLFPAYDSDGDGFVTGAEAVTLFTRSGLSRSDLKVVWDMAGTQRPLGSNRWMLIWPLLGCCHLSKCSVQRNNGAQCSTCLPSGLHEMQYALSVSCSQSNWLLHVIMSLNLSAIV